MDVSINFNEEVKVKLTAVGIDILQEQRRVLNLHIKGKGGAGLGELDLKTDDDGYTRFQLWDLMNRFGEHMRLGHPEPFQGTMIFPQAKPIDTVKIKGVEVPLCISCGFPTKKESEVSEFDKPTARIVCRECYGK